MSIRRPDDIYEALIAAQAGMSEAESLRFSARLILLLIDRIGDDAAVTQAIAAARVISRQVASPADSEITENKE